MLRLPFRMRIFRVLKHAAGRCKPASQPASSRRFAMLRMSPMTVPSYEDSSWRQPVTDVESELCSLRTAVESSQRGLSQLEAREL